MKWEDKYFNDDRHSIKNGTLYITKNLMKIPVFREVDGIVCVSFNRNIPTQVRRSISFLLKNNYKIRLVSPSTFNPKFMRCSEDTIVRENFRNMLHDYRYPNFFHFFEANEIDFTEILANYIQETGEWEVFNEEWDKFYPSVMKPYYDYYSGTEVYDDKEYIRDKISKLYRNIKIMQILV